MSPIRQGHISLPTNLTRGLASIFNPDETMVNVFKKPYIVLMKFLLILSSIAFIFFGLFMIDESCGCVRAQDKLMMWMLKIHVIAAVTLLLCSIFFSVSFPRFSMLAIFGTISGLLVIDSWIYYNYKRCIGKEEMVRSDERFLSWLIASLVLSGALWLSSLVVFGVVINRYGKQKVGTDVKLNINSVLEKGKEAESYIKNQIISVNNDYIQKYKDFNCERYMKKKFDTSEPNPFVKIPPEQLIQECINIQKYANKDDMTAKIKQLVESNQIYIDFEKKLISAKAGVDEKCNHNVVLKSNRECTSAIDTYNNLLLAIFNHRDTHKPKDVNVGRLKRSQSFS